MEPVHPMQRFKQKIASLEIYTSLREYMPGDHSRPQSLYDYVEQFYLQFSGSATVLDLGCGGGESMDWFRGVSDDTIWHGVDIENSPEVRQRVRKNDLLISLNGVDLPYADNYFDLIFCQQVLEHVRHPDKLIADAFRVLKPGGLLLGAVSYLEPYHSYSIFNFTPYGIVRVFGDAGFEFKEIRPGADASLLITRQLFNRSRRLRAIWKQSYLYGMTDLIGVLAGLDHRERNFLKIQFSGHLVFMARRPDKR
jgi:SAM-dependent methyltransferase